MARFRVIVHTESEYIVDVEAHDPDTAATMARDQVRAGEIKPLVQGISGVRVHRKDDLYGSESLPEE